MDDDYSAVMIRITYVNGLVTERVRKNMEKAIVLINTLNVKEIEEIDIFNFRCTKDFYDNIPDTK